MPSKSFDRAGDRDRYNSNVNFLPLADNFLVLMILAANSNPVDFCTHLLTIEKAPLSKQKQTQISFDAFENVELRDQRLGHESKWSCIHPVGLVFVTKTKPNRSTFSYAAEKEESSC